MKILNIPLIVVLLIHITSVLSETKEPTFLEAQVGSYIVLNCDLDFPNEAEQPYKLKWNKDGKLVFQYFQGQLIAADEFLGRLNLIDDNSNYGGGTINLTSIRESDGGWYHCQVAFINRTPQLKNNGTWYYLAIDGGALMKIPPINQTVLEGEKAVMQCVMKYPDVSTVTWQKDGENIMSLYDLANRAYIEVDGSLLITATAISDLGEYECVIRDIHGEQQSAKAYLNVQYPAKVIYSAQEVYFPYGRPAVLNCHFLANPPLKALKWMKDDILYVPSNVPGVELYKNGSLYFRKVDESHEGSYSCEPHNELGRDKSNPTRVIVQYPPYFTVKPKQIHFTKLGYDITLRCEARDKRLRGSDRPQIVWERKDGQKLPADRTLYEGGNLTIEAIREEDRGIYMCSAQNEAAKITAETEIYIEKVPPMPPYNISANSSETAVTLRWQPGSFGGLTRYTVWYRYTDSQEWRTVSKPNDNEYEMTVESLYPGREYEFMILGHNADGDGVFSIPYRYLTLPRDFNDPEQFRDPQRIDPFSQMGPPRNLSIERGEDGIYVAKWDPPSFGRKNLRMYILRYYTTLDRKYVGNFPTYETFVHLKNLEEDQTYTFQVSAISLDNYEAASDEFELTIPPIRRRMVIAIGTCTGIVFILICVAIVLYTKRKWFLRMQRQNEVDSNVKI